jgi:uncharacterized protein YyaL (SSP411 family)
MAVVEDFIVPPEHLILAGGIPGLHSPMITAANSVYAPGLTMINVNEGSLSNFLERFPMMSEMKEKDGTLTAYYCSNFTCRLPVTEAERLRQQMNR